MLCHARSVGWHNSFTCKVHNFLLHSWRPGKHQNEIWSVAAPFNAIDCTHAAREDEFVCINCKHFSLCECLMRLFIGLVIHLYCLKQQTLKDWLTLNCNKVGMQKVQQFGFFGRFLLPQHNTVFTAVRNDI